MISGLFELDFSKVYSLDLQGSGAAGSWWALRELTGGRCFLKSHAELGHAALKFLLANTSAKTHLGLGPKMVFLFLVHLKLMSFQLYFSDTIRIHGDMLRRDRSTLQKDTTLYDCGFPCQPFSLLNNNSRLLDEPQAEVFRESMRTIYSVEPLICVLENVVGVLRVWETMERYLKKHIRYFFGRLIIDPVKLGDCVRRRRVYILMIHKLLGPMSQGFVFLGGWS